MSSTKLLDTPLSLLQAQHAAALDDLFRQVVFGSGLSWNELPKNTSQKSLEWVYRSILSGTGKKKAATQVEACDRLLAGHDSSRAATAGVSNALYRELVSSWSRRAKDGGWTNVSILPPSPSTPSTAQPPRSTAVTAGCNIATKRTDKPLTGLNCITVSLDHRLSIDDLRAGGIDAGCLMPPAVRGEGWTMTLGPGTAMRLACPVCWNVRFDVALGEGAFVASALLRASVEQGAELFVLSYADDLSCAHPNHDDNIRNSTSSAPTDNIIPLPLPSSFAETTSTAPRLPRKVKVGRPPSSAKRPSAPLPTPKKSKPKHITIGVKRKREETAEADSAMPFPLPPGAALMTTPAPAETRFSTAPKRPSTLPRRKLDLTIRLQVSRARLASTKRQEARLRQELATAKAKVRSARSAERALEGRQKGVSEETEESKPSRVRSPSQTGTLEQVAIQLRAALSISQFKVAKAAEKQQTTDAALALLTATRQAQAAREKEQAERNTALETELADTHQYYKNKMYLDGLAARDRVEAEEQRVRAEAAENFVPRWLLEDAEVEIERLEGMLAGAAPDGGRDGGSSVSFKGVGQGDVGAQSGQVDVSGATHRSPDRSATSSHHLPLAGAALATPPPSARSSPVTPHLPLDSANPEAEQLMIGSIGLGLWAASPALDGQ